MQLPPTTEVSPEKNANFTKRKNPRQKVDSTGHFTGSQLRLSPELVFDSSAIGIRAEDLGGRRLNEFGRCWRRLVGRQSAWQEESCGAFMTRKKTKKKKKRPVPQRGIWMGKHLLFGPTQICFPLESVELCSNSRFERDPVHLYVSSSTENKKNMTIAIATQPSSHRHTDFGLIIKTILPSLDCFFLCLPAMQNQAPLKW